MQSKKATSDGKTDYDLDKLLNLLGIYNDSKTTKSVFGYDALIRDDINLLNDISKDEVYALL